MKSFFFAALALTFFACSHKNTQQTLILQSSKQDIRVRIQGQMTDWHISPELKPDVLKVECIRDRNKVVFITDKDSVSFHVALHDTINFVVLLNGKDSAYTQIVGAEKNVNFTDAYIKANRGKFGAEIPEVHELANVLVALSNVGRTDSNMVDMTTPYYKEVMSYFGQFDKHPAVKEMNAHLTKAMEPNTYGYYYALKMNACGYDFNNDGAIVNRGFVRHMGFNSPGDPFETRSAVFADFAKVSNFRSFYQKHTTYYDSLVRLYKQLNPIDKMQTWLSKKFGFDYGSYYVYFSPLIGGAHATTRFSDNNFDQTFMFVCSAEMYYPDKKDISEMLNSRVVFTEIDHNFVNIVSDKFMSDINKAFQKRETWVKAEGTQGTDMYGSAYAVFNEYMTFAVYSLYCMDNFKKQDADEVIKRMEKLMSNGRGFRHFKAFNQQLIALYQKNKQTPMEEFYRQMLDWCATQA